MAESGVKNYTNLLSLLSIYNYNGTTVGSQFRMFQISAMFR